MSKEVALPEDVLVDELDELEEEDVELELDVDEVEDELDEELVLDDELDDEEEEEVLEDELDEELEEARSFGSRMIFSSQLRMLPAQRTSPTSRSLQVVPICLRGKESKARIFISLIVFSA